MLTSSMELPAPKIDFRSSPIADAGRKSAMSASGPITDIAPIGGRWGFGVFNFYRGGAPFGRTHTQLKLLVISPTLNGSTTVGNDCRRASQRASRQRAP
jgi:hypothetical protein